MSKLVSDVDVRTLHPATVDHELAYLLGLEQGLSMCLFGGVWTPDDDLPRDVLKQARVRRAAVNAEALRRLGQPALDSEGRELPEPTHVAVTEEKLGAEAALAATAGGNLTGGEGA